MRARIAAVVVSCALAGAPAGARAEEPAAVDCGAWYEQLVALMCELPAYAEALARMDDEQRAAARESYVADCEAVLSDPDGHPDDLRALGCVARAETVDQYMRCFDPSIAREELRRSEPYGNMDAMRTAERAYEACWDELVACAPTPAEIPAGTAVPFEGGGYDDFMKVGWLPDGDVTCRYSIRVDEDGMQFEIKAECDQDGDGEIAVWKATRDDEPHRVTPAEVR
jgi:hypothetical protein